MSITAHPYSSEDDYARMRALLFTLCAESGSPLYCTVGDLDWWRYKLDDPAMPPVRLWIDELGILAGFTWLNNRGEVDLIVHPWYRAIEDEMLAQAEHEQGNRQADTGQTATLTAWAYTRDDERHMVLRRPNSTSLSGLASLTATTHGRRRSDRTSALGHTSG